MTNRTPLVAAGVVIAAACMAGCGASTPTFPSSTALIASLTSTTESEHYVFRHASDTVVDVLRQERFHIWWVTLFGVDAPSKIRRISRASMTAEAR